MRFDFSLKRPFPAILLLLLAPPYASGGDGAGSARQQAAEPATATSTAQVQNPSDREKAGLRGSVDECIEEMRYGQGNWKAVNETTYDVDGRTLQNSYTNNDGTKGLETFSYDAEGHLLQTAWTGRDEESDTVYNYDSQGRLLGIIGQGDWTTTFEYDAQGRKTRIVKSNLAVSNTSAQDNVGTSIGSENVDLFIAPPRGGWVTTSFNERDQPIESQVYESTGKLTRRLTRSYDGKGRVSDSTYVIVRFESLLPPAIIEQLASDREAFGQMESEFAKFLGPQQILSRTSYTYDDQGRVKETDDQFGPSDNTITKITYNDRGDEAEEVRITSHDAQPAEEDVANFSYQYDSFGNWTEKIVSSAPTAKEPSRIWTIDRRTITYY